jgi:hypothetical protein
MPPDDANVAKAELSTCDGATSQSWAAYTHGTLRIYGHSICLDVVGGSTRLGTKVALIDGDAAADPHWQPGQGHRLPPYARTDLALRGAAKLIRRLHSAAFGFQSAITCYRFHPDPPQAGQIVSHGNLGPRNTVYKDGIPAAFIDWDAASLSPRRPGPSCLAAPHQLRGTIRPAPDLPARLRTFSDAYGLTDRKAILPALQRCALDQPEPLRWLQSISPELSRTL